MPATELIIRPKMIGEIDTLREIEQSARTRYLSIDGFEQAANAPSITVDRFDLGDTFVATWNGKSIGFVLTQVLDNMQYVTNISVSPNCSGRNIGQSLLEAVTVRALEAQLPAITLTTFKEPRWNAPWFRSQGFGDIPSDKIGPELRSIIKRQSEFLDPSTRVALWKPVV